MGIIWKTVSPKDPIKISRLFNKHTVRCGLVPYNGAKVLTFYRKSNSVELEQPMVSLFCAELPRGKRPLHIVKAYGIKWGHKVGWSYGDTMTKQVPEDTFKADMTA
jgi:hypothetical protein